MDSKTQHKNDGPETNFTGVLEKNAQNVCSEVASKKNAMEVCRRQWQPMS